MQRQRTSPLWQLCLCADVKRAQESPTNLRRGRSKAVAHVAQQGRRCKQGSRNLSRIRRSNTTTASPPGQISLARMGHERATEVLRHLMSQRRYLQTARACKLVAQRVRCCSSTPSCESSMMSRRLRGLCACIPLVTWGTFRVRKRQIFKMIQAPHEQKLPPHDSMNPGLRVTRRGPAARGLLPTVVRSGSHAPREPRLVFNLAEQLGSL